MRIVWDEAKLETNLRKHGLDFADAEQVKEHLVGRFTELKKGGDSGAAVVPAGTGAVGSSFSLDKGIDPLDLAR